MGLSARINTLYNQLNQSQGITIAIRPTGADANTEAAGTTLTGGKAWAYGAWGEIATAAAMTADYWFIGAHIYTIVVADNYVVQFGTGAAGAEAGFAKMGVGTDETTAVGERVTLSIFTGIPRRIAASTRLAARVANGAAGAANTVIAKGIIATGL